MLEPACQEIQETRKISESTILQVGVLIDSPTPCAWVAQLLRKIQAHKLMQLHILIDENALEKESVVSGGWSESAGQWLIEKIIDLPNFDHDPWAAESLPKALSVSYLSEQADTLSSCDVILHLTPRELSTPFTHRYDKIWTAELPALHRRIAHYILTRAPFVWVHLWQIQSQADSQKRQHRRIASHALPCQTYSISDLQRLTYSALSGIFMSRLVWLANRSACELESIEDQAIQQGVFNTERKHAEVDAQQTLALLDKRVTTDSNNHGSRYSNNNNGGTHGVDTHSSETCSGETHSTETHSTETESESESDNKKSYRLEQRHCDTNLTSALGLLIRQSYERLHNRLFSERWELALALKESHDNSPQAPTVSKISRLASAAKVPVHHYKSITRTTDAAWADPHLVEHHGNTFVFFEKMHKHSENAHIAYAALDKNGEITKTGVALSAESHLSFPCVFSHNNDFYMIPETASQQSINLYKAIRFPDSWEHQGTLLSGVNAADTVMFHHQNRWWMFTNCQSHHSVDERDELHIYFADELKGPWQAHALNPVLTGVDRSRMAGAIIEEDGWFYRPSQYGAYRYGFGINLNRIDMLTPFAYRESAGWRILPDAGTTWKGCHSFAHSTRFTMIDRIRFRRR